MNHIILAVGKLGEAHWRQASHEYIKRLSRFGRCEVAEIAEQRLPRHPSAAQVAQAVEAEGRHMLERLRRTSARVHVCGLFIEGERRSSEQLADWIGALPQQGYSEAAWLIGGSHGLSPHVKAACHKRLSFSDMTFPHQLMRVLLCEQLYRAECILAHTEYHK